jgi:hypothetical protein
MFMPFPALVSRIYFPAPLVILREPTRAHCLSTGKSGVVDAPAPASPPSASPAIPISQDASKSDRASLKRAPSAGSMHIRDAIALDDPAMRPAPPTFVWKAAAVFPYLKST